MSAILLAALALGQFSGAMNQATVTDADGTTHTVITSRPSGPIILRANPLAGRGSAVDYSANPRVIGGAMATPNGAPVIPFAKLPKAMKASKAVVVTDPRSIAHGAIAGGAAVAALAPKVASVHPAK